MKIKGLILSMIFEAESANYGEGIGNVASLKKMARGNGEQYTYISRQALRYRVINGLDPKNNKIRCDAESVCSTAK